MSDQPDAADDAERQAVDRLERALDRIAAMARDFDVDAVNPGVAELRARLDHLVATLRTTLAASGDADGD